MVAADAEVVVVGVAAALEVVEADAVAEEDHAVAAEEAADLEDHVVAAEAAADSKESLTIDLRTFIGSVQRKTVITATNTGLNSNSSLLDCAIIHVRRV